MLATVFQCLGLYFVLTSILTKIRSMSIFSFSERICARVVFIAGPYSTQPQFKLMLPSSLNVKKTPEVASVGESEVFQKQAVEVEFDKREYTYRLVRAATVMDAGRVLNPAMADAVVKGGMCMGLGLGSRECFQYDQDGRVLDTSLRTYKVMHFGETPEYLVGFVETPQLDSPYAARGIAEHGIIGMPAALGNALSLAAGVELDELPLVPETIWRIKTQDSAEKKE